MPIPIWLELADTSASKADAFIGVEVQILLSVHGGFTGLSAIRTDKPEHALVTQRLEYPSYMRLADSSNLSKSTL